MKKFPLYQGFLVILPFIFSCAGPDLEKDSLQTEKLHIKATTKARIQKGTWDGSRNIESGLDGRDIVLFEDFEASDYKERWPVYWGKPVGAGTVSRPAKYVFSGKRSAYLASKIGQHKSEGRGEYVPKIPLDEVAYVRLYMRLQDGFSIGLSRQLKLFKISGGAGLKNSYGGAGNKPTGKDKFSVTMAIDNWREFHLYYYHPDQRRRWGDRVYCKKFFCREKFSSEKWYCLELMLKLNTPGLKNGELKAWVDGRLVIKVDKLRFRDTNTVKIRRFTIGNYWGGSRRRDTSPKDQRIFIDNYVVSRKRIGCFGVNP